MNGKSFVQPMAYELCTRKLNLKTFVSGGGFETTYRFSFKRRSELHSESYGGLFTRRVSFNVTAREEKPSSVIELNENLRQKASHTKGRSAKLFIHSFSHRLGFPETSRLVVPFVLLL